MTFQNAKRWGSPESHACTWTTDRRGGELVIGTQAPLADGQKLPDVAAASLTAKQAGGLIKDIAKNALSDDLCEPLAPDDLIKIANRLKKMAKAKKVEDAERAKTWPEWERCRWMLTNPTRTGVNLRVRLADGREMTAQWHWETRTWVAYPGGKELLDVVRWAETRLTRWTTPDGLPDGMIDVKRRPADGWSMGIAKTAERIDDALSVLAEARETLSASLSAGEEGKPE
jgi:hypothetical protein